MKRRAPLRSDPEKRRRFLARGRKSSAEWARRTRSRLQRKTGVNPVNRERKARMRGDEVYGPYHEWIGTLHCLREGPGCFGEVTGHHVRSVAAGGRDEGNEVPLCRSHHAAVHAMGYWTTCRRWGVDLAHEARRIAEVAR